MHAKTMASKLSEILGRTVTTDDLSVKLEQPLKDGTNLTVPVDVVQKLFEASAAKKTELRKSEDPKPEEAPKIHIVGSGSGHKAKEQQFTANDRRVAKQLESIQKQCAVIPRDHYVRVEVGDGKSVDIYRPPVKIVLHEGLPYYAYSSLISSDGMLLMDGGTYNKYETRWSRRHMPFVSDEKKAEIVALLEQYSFFSGVCAYPECVQNVKGDFDPGLPKKAELLVRKKFLPPALPAKGSMKVMDLKSMCYTHWLLGEMRPRIEEHWMQITVDTQGMPPEDRQVKRIEMFTSLIDDIQSSVQAKAKATGEREASIDEIGQMLIAFATEMTGSK